jgi:murein DD-endopeptidase MepM/ murein hydrolase activator NlpD
VLALREGRVLGLATLGLMVALGPVAARADPPVGPRTLQRAYEVQPGDTLNSLARKHGITVATIVKANRLPGPNARLRAGQRLVIPVVETPLARRGEISAPSAAPRPAAPASARPPTRLVLAVPDFDGAALAFAWPVEGPVISTFGQRRNGWHGGIDIKAPPGTPVWAAAGGVVIASGVEAAYGLVVKIEHWRGFVTVYAHNDVNLVEVGDHIGAGEMIALVGQTGRATTPHVHFEIRRDGLAYNPLYLLPLPPRIAQIDETAQRPHE